MYTNFAYYYDKIMNVNYEVFLGIVKKYIKNEGLILDAGCGTGSILIPLVKAGYNVVGIDNSSEMLEVTYGKLQQEGLYAKLYENDLQEPFAQESFLAVISFFDVINYIKDYEKTFKNIYDSLIPGGVFIFDVHQVSYLDELVGYEEKEDCEDFRYEWLVEKGNEENSIRHDLAIFVGDEVFHEKHYQRTYSKDIYFDILTKIGFEPMELTESDEYKLFILAKKRSKL